MSVDPRFWNPQERQLVYAVETRNHKGSKEPFSKLESRRLSPEAKAVMATTQGDLAALEYLVVQIAKGVPAIHSANAWRTTCNYKPEGVSRAVVSRWLLPETKDADLAKMIPCNRSQIQRGWIERLDQIHRATLKGWAEEAAR